MSSSNLLKTKITLEDVNALTTTEFHKLFINVVECWPEAAIFVSALLPFHSFDFMLSSFDRYLEQLNIDNKVRILRQHPDLAGKLADERKLTIESAQEQASVGLDKLTPEIKRKLTDLNESYKAKFGFPFIICVRENKLEKILEGLEERVKNSGEDEISTGIGEVKKICKLRIKEIVSN